MKLLSSYYTILQSAQSLTAEQTEHTLSICSYRYVLPYLIYVHNKQYNAALSEPWVKNNLTPSAVIHAYNLFNNMATVTVTMETKSSIIPYTMKVSRQKSFTVFAVFWCFAKLFP